jgi:hypothetical protein
MLIRVFAILMLLPGSAFAGSGSNVQTEAVVADLPASASSSQKVDDKPARQTAPPIRVILPSPYAVRTN